MKPLYCLMLAMLAATSANAQNLDHSHLDHSHLDHSHHDHMMPMDSAPKTAPAPNSADSHDGHQHDDGQPPATPAENPHAHHQMQAPTAEPAPTTDPHAGHAGHTMPNHAPAPPPPPVSGPPAAALGGPIHAADGFFDAKEMARAREIVRTEHGAITTHKIIFDQLETRFRNGRNGYSWDMQAYYGTDTDRFVLKSEGEGSFGSAVESAEAQALYSHALNPWFNLQMGVRHELRPRPQRTHLVLGLEGLAPQWLSVDTSFFLSNKGDLTARAEVEIDQRITQKLILQPNVELGFAAQNVAELGIGSGLSTIDAGLRLRYEIIPEFAPYIGVEYGRAIGRTADYARANGDDVGGWNVLLGIRTWF